MDAHEFAGWRAYWQLEPWGDGPMDVRMAKLLSMLSNWWCSNRKDMTTPAEFMLHQQPEPEPQPVDQQILIMKSRSK